MANLSERRRFERKRIRLRCHLVMDTGLAIEGYTRDLSHEGLFLQTHGIPSTRRHKEPSPGDQALLIIHFTREKRPESIRTTCRLVHINSAGIGVYFSFSALTRQDQEAIVKILDTETTNI